MKKFQFQFENILKQKENLEEEAKQAFKKAQNELNQWQDRLDGLKNSLNVLNNGEQRTSVDINQLRQKEAYCDYLVSQIAVCKNSIGLAERKVDFCRNNLTKAKQEKEIFIKIKEKNYQAFLGELNHQEQKIIDELALYSYMRGKGQKIS